VTVESTDYPIREYGVTASELEFFFLGDHKEIQKLIRANR